MTKKLFFALSLMTALAIGCSKSGEPVNPTTGGDEDTPGPIGGNGGVYSETFAGYSGKVDSGYLANESFTSTATGVTWNLDFGKIDQTEDHEAFYEGHCFTMGGKAGKADDGKSVLSTSVLSDGITHLEFDYVANKEKQLEVQVIVDNKVVWTSNAMTLVNNGTSDPKVPEHKSFDISGASANAFLKFINISEARRISIGNITWTNATGKGGNGKIFEGGSGSGEGGEGEGGESGEDDIYTSLTSDITVADINYAGAEYYGDDFDYGTNDWVFYMGNDDEELCFELFTELNATTPVGSYTIDLDYSGAKGTAWEGYYSDSGIMPAYYNYNTDDYAYPASGDITIAKGSGSSYNITVAVYDELGHKISASYSGAMTIKEGEWEEEESDAYATVKSAGKAILKSHKAHKDVKAVKVSKNANSSKAAKGKRAHKAKAIRIAR